MTLSFYLNWHAYAATEGEAAQLVFTKCNRWRWDITNDKAWYSGRGRFSGQAPEWGEFYEILGNDPHTDDLDWEVILPDQPRARHFIFYFRDEAIECIAEEWTLVRECPDIVGRR